MKTYRVRFQPEAQREALEAADFIAANSPANADKWFDGLVQVIESLRTMPQRCSRARESETLGVELRQYIYHSHRIIFRIEERTRTLRVLHIRHASRRALGDSAAASEE